MDESLVALLVVLMVDKLLLIVDEKSVVKLD